MSEMKVGSTEWRLNNLRGQVAMGFPCAPDSDSSALLQLGDERDTLRAELQQALARNTDLSAEVERLKGEVAENNLGDGVIIRLIKEERDAALAKLEKCKAAFEAMAFYAPKNDTPAELCATIIVNQYGYMLRAILDGKTEGK